MEGAAAENVDVKMKNRLARSLPGVDDGSIAPGIEAPFVRQAPCNQKEMAQQRLVFRSGIEQ